MTEKRFEELLSRVNFWILTEGETAELRAAITFTPEPVRYFQKRVEVPEPCREALNIGDSYWIPKIVKGKAYAIFCNWENHFNDHERLLAGLIYLTPEHATARAAAWLEIEVGE